VKQEFHGYPMLQVGATGIEEEEKKKYQHSLPILG
jgi:hypothetical protein